MTLPKYNELAQLNTVAKIDEEILLLRKTLLDLKLKLATKKEGKSHLFAHTKRRIAQLYFKKSGLLKLN
jgi:ribosomal protein L29